MSKNAIVVVLALALFPAALRAQNSPNGPPGPAGNPTPPTNEHNGGGNQPAPLPPDPSNPPAPSNPASPEARAPRAALIRFFQAARVNIFSAQGDVIQAELLPAVNSSLNVAGLSSAMSATAQTEASAIATNIEQRMSQIRDASYHNANVFLLREQEESRQTAILHNPALWIAGTGIFAGSPGTYTRTGLLSAGIDYSLNPHMVLGLMGVYGYSDSSISGVKGHLLGNSMVGGVYFGAWTGKTGPYLTMAGLVNQTDFTVLNGFSPRQLNWTGFASTGYDYSCDDWSYGPVASIETDNASTNNFRVSEVRIHDNATYALQSRIGLRASRRITLGSNLLKPQLQLMWEHHFNGNGAVDVEYIDIPNTRVSTGQGSSSRDSAWIDASVSFYTRSRWSLQSSYVVDLGKRFFSQQVDLSFHVNF